MSRFDSGFIFGYRAELNEDICDNVILWGIWNTLLRMATYKPSQILWEGQPRKLPPGSVVFSPKEFAARWRLSKSVIIKWLHRLENSQRIVIESCPRGTLITICNWSDFQNTEEEACSQRVHNEDTTCSQRGHNETLSEEVKKERRKEKEITRLKYSEEFEEIWKLYDRKGDKKKSFEIFNKLKIYNGNLENLKLSISNYLRDKPDKVFRKDLERFLQMDWSQFLTLQPKVIIKSVNEIEL